MMKKRLIAFLLVLTMTITSFGDVWTGSRLAAAEEDKPLATPTDLADNSRGLTDPPASKYTVRYLIDGEQDGDAEEYEAGAALTLRDAPGAREGYTFSGWSGLPETMPAENVTVAGSWQINTYTVTYMLEGVQSGDAETHEYDAQLTLRDDPEAREGYTFSGWSGLPETMPDEDVTVTGSWIQDEEDDTDGAVMLGGTRALGAQSGGAMLGAGNASTAGGSSETVMTALEQLIEEQMNDQGSTLSGRMRILLDINTTYSGKSLISAKQRTVADDFVLELVAKDAGEDGTKGSGQTVIDDDLTIKGIKVIMQSVVIASGKKVSVKNAEDADTANQSRGGALEYVGVESLPTELNVEVGKNSSLDVKTVGKADKITVTAATGAKSVNINAGDGTNTILATVSGGDLNIQTGQDQDNVEVRIIGTANSADATSQIGNVTVDTGAGNDTLYILNNGQSKNETSQAHNVERTETVLTPDGQPAKDENGNVITTTYKEDVLSGIVVSAGSGDDTITLDVRANAGNMILNTGAGGDVVEVRKGDLNTAEDLDYDHVYEPYETVRNEANTTKVIINNGAVDPSIGTDAVDFVTIDVSVARAISGIELKGGKGASVHLKGTLATQKNNGSGTVEEDDRIKWADAARKTLEVQAATTLDPTNAFKLNITVNPDANAKYNFTDKLANKKQESIHINADGDGNFSTSLALTDFTDYVVKSHIADVNRISILNTNNATPFLSNLVLDTDETHDGDTLEINNIYNVTGRDAQGNDILAPIPLNILVKAPTIEFNGTVKALNVRAESVQGSKPFDYIASLSRSVDDTIDNAINLYDCAEIIVNKDAVIETENDTALLARVKHFGGTLSLAWMLNIVNIKVATADIQIDGKITAGGSVTADAKIQTTEGVKIVDVEGETGNPTGVLVTDGDAVPLGIKIVVNDASVNVSKDAAITAAEDALLRSRSDITVMNYENGTLPFAIAASYINNDVKTIVEGTVNAGRSVLISADGKILSDNRANHRKDTEDGAANVFVALNIVDQDVDAIIRGGTVTAERGDVAIYATAIANIKTIASASSMQKEMTSSLPEAINPVNVLVTVLTAVITPFKAGYKWIRSKFRDADYYAKKLESTVNKISASNYDVSVARLSPENEEMGTATVKIKVSKFTAGDDTHKEGEVAEGQEGGVTGLFAVVDVKPKSGYAVKKVQYRYLTKEQGNREGESFNYVSVLPNDQGNYIFALKYKNTPYEVIVTYRKSSDPADNNADGERVSIDLDDLEDVYDINGVMDDAEDGADEDAEKEEENSKKTGKDYIAVGDMTGKTKVNLGIEIPRAADNANTNDRILTWQTVPNANGIGEHCLTEVYAGQEIRFIGNAESKDNELKKLIIKYYVRTESGQDVPVELEVKPDKLKRFIFTVPDNIVGGTEHNISVTGEFGPKDTTAGPAHNQVTGSLGVSYVNNKSKARIESRTEKVDDDQGMITVRVNGKDETFAMGVKKVIITPVVTAGGKVDMLSIHTTSVETLADGSAVKGKPAISADASEGKPQETQKVKWTIPGTDYAVKVTSNLQGEITTAMTKGQDDENGHATFSHPVFTFTPTTANAQYSTDRFHIEVSYYTKFNMSLTVGKRVTDDYSLNGATLHPDPETTVTLSHTAGGLTITITRADGYTKTHTVAAGTEATVINDEKAGQFTVSGDRKTITFGEGDTALSYSTKMSNGDDIEIVDGKITFKPSFGKMAVVEGTTVDVSFIFLDTEGNTIADGNGSSKYAVANPVNIQFNALKKDKGLAATITNGNMIEMGTITYHNTITDSNTHVITYQFAVKANPGYKLDSKGSNYGSDRKSNTSKLYASWVGPDGQTYKQALVRDESGTFNNAEVWNFTLSANSGIPAGATVSIMAVFEKDARTIVFDDPDGGSAQDKEAIQKDLQETQKVSKTAVAEEDNVTVKLALSDEKLQEKYAVASVKWHLYGDLNNSHEVDLDENGQAKIKIQAGQFATGAASADIVFVPVVQARNVTFSPATENIKLSETKKGYIGEKVKVTLSEEDLLEGKKISAIKINGVLQTTVDAKGKTINRTADFIIPNDAGGSTLNIEVETRDGQYAIESYTDPEGLGSIVPVCAKADNGETVQLKIEPKAGYRAEYGTVKVTLTSSKRTRRIAATWVADNQYKFDLALDDDERLTAPIKIEGKFEEGQDGVALSLGVAAAVGIIIGENSVEIKDGVITAVDGLSMSGLSIGGKASTEAKAGYSAGKTGVAGALGIQIASAKNNVIIHEDEEWEKQEKNDEKRAEAKKNWEAAQKNPAIMNNPLYLNSFAAVNSYEVIEKEQRSSINLPGKTVQADDPENEGKTKDVFVPGSITLISKNSESFKVTGDASNKTKSAAKGTGVGAGIAVAIDQVKSVAEIEDGVILNAEKLNSLTVKAETKAKDKVAAAAGAIGGSAFVPVAAVDIYLSDVKARVGKLQKQDSTGKAADFGVLDVAGTVKIAAEAAWTKLLHNHEVTADASARGGDATLGGAIIVTWMDTDVKAELNQSVKAGDVSVTSSASEALKAVAVAAVSGGQPGSADSEKGKGSADKQADNVLNGAAGMAGKYGDMDGDAIKADGENRQKAETAEQTVAGAGAIALNIMKNKSRAKILDGVDVEAAKKLKVTSMNRTEATVRANASTTNSDTGVGVGVALNIVKMDNIAYIGTGTIKANELELRAEIAEAPSYALEILPTEGKTPFGEQIKEAVEKGLKKLIGDNFVTDALSETAERIAVKLIDDLNLTKLFASVGDNALDTLANAAETLTERVKGLPKALVSPLWTLVEQAIGTVSGWDEERFSNLFEDVWTTATIQLAGNAAGMTRTVLQESMGSLINSGINMANRLLNGEGFDVDIVVDKLKSTVVNLYDRLLEKTVQDVIKRMSAEIPLMTESNMQLLRDMKDISFQKIKDSIIPYVTKTIRDQVWDYEPVLLKVKEDGFKDYLKNEAKALLKEGTAALTNEMIDGIVGKLGKAFSREPVSDRHVITTQAISGAGAKTNSGAGSISIAVVNMETRAEIAASTNTVTVNGDLVVNAQELRRIRTHASAAVDARNGEDPLDTEPDNNEGVGDSDQANTGSSNAAAPNSVKSQNGVTTVAYSDNGTVVADHEGIDGYIKLTPNEGYKIPKQITRTWVTKDGQTHSELFDLNKTNMDDDNGFYIFKKLDKKLADITSMETTIIFEEDLKELPEPKFEYDEDMEALGLYEYDKKITLHVDGRENTEDGKAVAKATDIVKIVVPAKNGLQVKQIVVKDSSNNEQSFGKGEDDAITLVSSNKNESVYAFRMPKGTVKNVTVTFGDEELEDKEPGSKAKAKDGDKSVGVGAAFALTYGNSTVTAQIGGRKDTQSRGNVTAGTITITASSEHEEENYSTAGTDPIEGTSYNQEEGAGEKDVGADASLAINILDNDIYAGIAQGTKVRTTAIPGVNDPERGPAGQKKTTKPETNDDATALEDTGEDEPEDIEVHNGSLIISATEVSENETKASAYATGSTTAVGASVAVNVSLSEIEARLGSGAEASGKVVVRSHSLSRDNTWSFASAMGADVQRNLNSLAEKREKSEKVVNDLTTGEIVNKKSESKGNDTGDRVAKGMNRNKAEGGEDARGDIPVSQNAMRSQGASADSAKDGYANLNNKEDGGNALNNVKDVSGHDLGGGKEEDEKSDPKLQVAATVAFTVSNHKAKTNVFGTITAKDGEIELTSYNAGNFRTRATAAAMSLAEATGGGKDIALAFGVSVNKNEAIVDVRGNLEAPEGDVKVDANLKQNLTDEYKGFLAIQSVSGSFSGKGYDYSIAGALSMLFSHATTKATVVNSSATETAPATIKGDTVSIKANDKSKLAIRAGGINVSDGASKGAGVSIATIWSGNTVEASVGDNTRIETEDFTLSAQKEKVVWGDFEWPVGKSNFLTDSSELNDEQRDNVYTGLIDVHKKPGEKTYTVDINADSYALMNFVDELNFLSSKNYYAEAIAGSLVKARANDGDANALNLAGSFSIVRTSNKINATLGKNVTILQKQAVAGEKATDAEKAAAAALNNILHENNVHISATGDTTARLIGGAISAGSAKTAAGVTVTFLYNKDIVNAKAGANLNITAGGKVDQKVSADMDVLTINAAAAASTEAEEQSKAVGGSFDMIWLTNKASNTIGDGAVIKGGSVDVTSDAEMDLVMIIISAMSAKNGTAAGGTVAYMDDQAEAKTKIGKNHKIEASTGDVNISAKGVDKIVSVAASASAARNTEDEEKGTAFAGTLNIIHSRAKGLVELLEGGSGNGITATKGSITLAGETETRAANATLSAAGGQKNAIGLNLNFNFFNRESGVSIKGGDGYQITAGKDVKTSADGTDLSVMAALALTASKKGNGVSGNLPIIVSKNTVKNTIGKASITAGGSASFTSDLKDMSVAVAGQVAVSMAAPDDDDGAAAGAAAMFVIKTNTVKTDLGTSTVTAKGGDILVHAKGKDQVYAITAGVAVSTSDKGVTGNMVISTNNNTIHAVAGQATLNAVNTVEKKATSGGNVKVEAIGNSTQWAVAGGLNMSYGNSIGAALLVLTAAKDVKATAHNMHAYGSVDVIADNKDSVNELSVNAGASLDDESEVTVETGISVQVLKNKVNAAVASTVDADTGSFTLKAKNRSNLDNINIALAASRSKLTATPVFALTYYGGETNALLGSGTVNASGAVSIIADANKDIDQYTIGAAGGTGKVALSGAVSLMFLKDSTNALVQHGTSINAGSLNVTATGNYDLTGASAAIAGNYDSDGNAGAINAIVTVAKANVLAEMEGEAALSGPALISASAARDIVDVAITVSAAAGNVGVGVTVMSLVAGDKMDSEAANMLAYGNTDTSGDKVFDSDAMIEKMEKMGVNTEDMKAHEETPDPRDRTQKRQITGIKEDLSGNQLYDDDGNEKGTYDVNTKDSGKFDASSGMVDQKDFQDDTSLGKDDREKEKQKQADGAEHDPENKDENRETKETSDVTNARGVGTTVYSSDPKDAVVARIAKDAKITARGVTVKAEQDSTADLFSATVGVGMKMGGAGVGFGIAILRSNVIAASLGTVDALDGNMAVTAESTSGKAIKDVKDDATAKERNDSLKNSFEDAGNIFTRSVRVVGIAVGAGKNGLGVAGSVARADNITQATVGGKISNVSNLTVSGAAKYDNIVAVTVAGAGGTEGGALAGSVAVAIADGTVGSKIDSTADISGKDTQILVATNSIFNAKTGAVTVAVGSQIGGTAGVSVVTNKLRQNTSVDNGAKIDVTGSEGTLAVTGTSSTYGGSMMLGAQFASTAAVGLGLSIISVNPEVSTTIGVNPKKDANGKEDQDAKVSLGKLKTVSVENDVESEAKSWLVSVSGSDKVAMSGNVLLVFNDTQAKAKIAKASGTIGSLRVSGNLDADGESVFAQAAVGGMAAIGASVSYVDVNSRNEASVDTDDFTAAVTGPVEVVTNDIRTGRTHASAIAVSGNVGLLGVGSLNAAVARNRAVNAAMINGKNGIGGSSVKLRSEGVATSETDLVGVAAGAATVNASVTVSLNEATSLSQMKIGGALDSDLNVSAKLTGKTYANQYTGSGGLVGFAINVSKAKGTSQALVDVDIGKAPTDPDKKIALTSKVEGSNDVKSNIQNQSLQAGTIGFMDGVSYSKDVYDNHVVLRGGNYNLSAANVTTDYISKAKAVVNPSALGVDFKLGEMTFDMAEAKGKAYARAQMDLHDGSITTDEDVNVTVTGWGSADSGIASTNYFALKGLSIGGSLARAELATSQVAGLNLDNGKILNAAALNVKSITDNATTGASHGASGTNDDPQSGFEITVGEFAMHYVRAKENINSTAMITGTGSEENTIKADSMTVRSGISKDGKTSSTAESKESASLSLISMGGLNTQARTADTFYSEVTGVNADIAGKITVYAKGDATAKSEATAPGDVSILELSVSHIKAGIGNGADKRQTAQVLIGSDTKLTSGGAMELYAENRGTTNTDYTKNTVFSAASVKFATIPTDSFYSTGVAIGKNAELTAGDTLTIRSLTRPNAKSDLDSLGAAALFDYSTIKGENHIDADNKIDIGQGTQLTATNTLTILASDNTRADAKTVVRGGGGILGGEVVEAENKVRRNVWITIDRDAKLKSSAADLLIKSVAGEGDNIVVESYVRSGGLFTIGKAKSVNDITTDILIAIGANVSLDAHTDLNLIARATSYLLENDKNEMEPDHEEDDKTLDPDETKVEEGLSEEEQEKKKQEREAAKNANAAQRNKTIKDSDDALSELEEDELPENENYGTANKDNKKAFGVYAKSNVKAKGAFVWPKSEASNILNYSCYISINRDTGNQDLDDVEMSELNAHTGDLTVRADNKGLRAKAEAYANGGGLYSDVIATARIEANLQNTIWVDFVNLYALNDEKENGKKAEIRLLANNYGDGDRPYLVAIAEAKDSGIFGDTDPTALISGRSFNQVKTYNRLTVDTRGEFIHIARNPADCIDYLQQENNDKDGKWAFGAAKRRCDFCYEDKGQSSYTPEIDYRDLDAALKWHMSKALIPLNDIESTVDKILSSFKARYIDEGFATASKIYVLNKTSMLEKDATLEKGSLDKYTLWTNTRTGNTVYLLPNATRLYANASGRLQYVSEIMTGDVLGDGTIHGIEIITALTKNAFNRPVISIGSTGQLDFSTGMLTLPSLSDFELYLDEVSSEWMLEKLNSGFIRRLDADQEAMNNTAANGGELPKGTMVEGLTAGEEKDGWKVWWFGATPETAEDPDQTLLFLLVNEETDEIDAFRTSVNMIENGEDPVDVSLYLYRDSKSDRMSEEKYNCLFFDTQEGQKSIVKVITDVLADRVLEMPLPLEIKLRGFELNGADLTGYAVSGMFFAMNNGNDGEVSMFDGAYEATYDGDVFESPFIVIEGIRSGDLQITLKEGQPVWPEWTGEDTARDVAGNEFVLVDGNWYPKGEEPLSANAESEDEAA